MMFSKKNTAIAVAIAATSCLMLPMSWANEGEQRGERRGPPPEAIQACASQTEGAACSFNGRRGEEVQGSCSVVPNDTDVIACKPQRSREGGRGSQSGH